MKNHQLEKKKKKQLIKKNPNSILSRFILFQNNFVNSKELLIKKVHSLTIIMPWFVFFGLSQARTQEPELSERYSRKRVLFQHNLFPQGVEEKSYPIFLSQETFNSSI